MRILCCICFICCMYMQAAMAAEVAPKSLSADAVMLIEAETGEIIYEKNADKRIYPASTTKIMTAILAIEEGGMKDVVTVGSNANDVEGSSMNLAAGDQLSMEELLYGVMMASGNDATIVIAEHLAGSVDKFARRMTSKAKEIGASNTHFVNSSGLPDKNHYSTARDLARIAAYGYRNDAFRELVGTAKREAKWISPAKSELIENTNLLLQDYQGANGIKTGYTEAAGECLVASAQRDGKALIAVIMHVDKDQRFAEAATLLDYGFSKVRLHTAYKKNELNRMVHVRGGRNYQVNAEPQSDIVIPIVEGNDTADFSVEVDLPKYVSAPIKEGQTVGYVRVLYKGIEINKGEIAATKQVEEGFNPIGLLIMWYDTLFETLKSFGFK